MNTSRLFFIPQKTVRFTLVLTALLMSLSSISFISEAAQMPEKETLTLSEGVEQTIDASSIPSPTQTEWVFKPNEATAISLIDSLTQSITIPQAPLALPSEITASNNTTIKKHRKRARSQQARLETIESYRDVVKSIMVEKISYDLYQEAMSLHRQAKQQFEAGTINHYELLAARHTVLKQNAQYLHDQKQKERAQRTLMYRLGNREEASQASNNALLFPKELSYLSGEFNWMSGDRMKKNDYASFTEFLSQAVSSSPEWHMLKAALRSKHPENSDYGALLHNRWHDAYLKHQQALEQLDLKHHQRDTASIILNEIIISEKAGFASHQDVIKARIGLTIASAEYVESKLDTAVAFYTLAREAGKLSPPAKN